MSQEEEFKNLVIKSRIFDFIKKPQIINKETKEWVDKALIDLDPEKEYMLEGLQTTPNAKKIIIEKINNYIFSQLLFLKEKMPRRLRGKNKSELIKKTINEKNEVLLKEFPKIQLFTLINVKKEIEETF